MPSLTGYLKKMRTQWDDPVQYHLPMNFVDVPLNPLIGKTISFVPTGNIFCIQCKRKTKKSYQQGHCFLCFRRLQECNLCVIHPEKCKVEEGRCSLDDWAHQHCHESHIVYLANTSGLKVGITRESNLPSRWIDQGAHQALKIFKVNNRYRAGFLEVFLKTFFADRTNWRAMLSQTAEDLDLSAIRDDILPRVLENESLIHFPIEHFTEMPLQLRYEVIQYPCKLKQFSLDNTAKIQGQLLGIKGQYLLLESGVLNIRKFGGYEVVFEVH